MYLVWELCDTEILTLCFPFDNIFAGTITNFNVVSFSAIFPTIFQQYFG